MGDEGPVLGIDLGTTNSLVSVFDDSGPQLIANSMGEPLTPSVVGYDDHGQILVGVPARERLITHPELTTSRFKRLMGTSKEVTLGKKRYRAEELSALVLRSLAADAEVELGEKIEEAVISVPAYFNDKQRQATIAAANLSGLKVTRLINEPTAASLAYGLSDRDTEAKILVIDLGGGTFDVSILELFSGVMEVRASSGDAFLGGEDFTDNLAKDLMRQIGVSDLQSADSARLRALANSMKHGLSEQPIVEQTFVYRNKEYPVSTSREQFEDLNSATLKKLRLPIQRVISDAGLRAVDLDRIILVGGATRMPCIHGMVTRLFQRFPEHEIDPDHVVALGSAVQAGLVARHEALEDVVMTDVAPFTLGFETSIKTGERRYESGHFAPLIERNTIVPVSRSETVSALEKGQTGIDLNIYQGESPYVRDNIKLGRLSIKIPRNTKEHEQVEVRYTYDNSGVLEVIARSLSTNKEKKLLIEGNPGAMSRDQIAKRFKELESLKIHPRDTSENVALAAELQVAFENSLGTERQYIQHLIQEFEIALGTQDVRVIENAREKLKDKLSQLDNNDVF